MYYISYKGPMSTKEHNMLFYCPFVASEFLNILTKDFYMVTIINYGYLTPNISYCLSNLSLFEDGEFK